MFHDLLTNFRRIYLSKPIITLNLSEIDYRAHAYILCSNNLMLFSSSYQYFYKIIVTEKSTIKKNTIYIKQ